MAFLAGVMLIDAPASALNNAGANDAARTDNAIATKSIRVRQGALPYVSAQAFRYWLRATLEDLPGAGWRAAPVYREAKVAYTDANPIRWWDDDLFGYMRAQSKRADAAERRGRDPARAGETPTSTEITRVSPFRVSTFVAIAPVSLVDDFGTMSRHDGDPVPHEHQFYRTALKGLFSLDLGGVGTFSYANRTGFRNLDDNRVQEARDNGLEPLEAEKSYRLPLPERIARVRALLEGIGSLAGGAKQALHYTDVTPAVILAAVIRGGNNPLQYAIQADANGQPAVNTDAVEELFRVWGDQILSPLHVGWVHGFHDAQRERMTRTLEALAPSQGFVAGHPREVLAKLADGLEVEANAAWLA
jgi:CRISPR-associated protein Cst2